MRILVINPPSSVEYSRMQRCHGKVDKYNLTYYDQIPVDLLYAAAVFRRAGHDVKLLDFSLRKRFNEYSKKLKAIMDDIDLIVVNSATTVINEDYSIIKSAKKKGARTILIGELCNYNEISLMDKYEDVDICVRGEIEGPLSEIASDKALADIKGITFRSDGKVIRNDDHGFCVLDDLAFPARDLSDWKDYRQPSDTESYTVITVSRGCPYNCTFCQNGGFSGNKARYRSVDSVIDEIRQCVDMGIRNFFFRAENFTLNNSFVSGLCKEIAGRKLKIRWSCSTRADLVDKEILFKMRKAGCWLIHYGVECTDDSALKELNKQCSEKQIDMAIRISKNLGLIVHASFIYGIGNDKKRMEKNFRLIRRHSIDFPAFFKLKAFKGTAIDKTEDEIDALLDDEFYEMIRRFSMSYYMSPRYIANTLRNIVHNPYLLKGLIINGPGRVMSLLKRIE